MNWKQIVGTVAPVLGTTLGGPLGGMAGKFIADALGVKEEELEETISGADTETMLKIKNLENDFKVKIKELGLKEEDLHQKDRASARNLAINTTLIPQAIISAVFITGFIYILNLVFTGEVQLEGSMKETGIFLLGILSAGITQVMNFFFGSSSGSKEKDNKFIRQIPL